MFRETHGLRRPGSLEGQGIYLNRQVMRALLRS